MRKPSQALCLLAAAVASLLVACAPSLIPGTKIRDSDENRAALDVLFRYKQALEARDAQAVLGLVSPKYFEAGKGDRPAQDFEALKLSLPADFGRLKAVRLDVTPTAVQVEGDSAAVYYFGVLNYAVETHNGEPVWKRSSDDNRLRLSRVGGSWKISGGL